MSGCNKCDDTGVVYEDGRELPCDCIIGETTFFMWASVIGPVTGEEIQRHFLRNSPEPIMVSGIPILATDLPGRREREIDLDLLEDEVRRLLSLLECREPSFNLWCEMMLRQLANIHALTSKALGK